MNLPSCVSMQDWVSLCLCLSSVRQWTCLCRNLAADWNTPRPPSSATMSWRGSGTRLVICRLHCIVTIGAWEVKTRVHVTAHVAHKQRRFMEEIVEKVSVSSEGLKWFALILWFQSLNAYLQCLRLILCSLLFFVLFCSFFNKVMPERYLVICDIKCLIKKRLFGKMWQPILFRCASFVVKWGKHCETIKTHPTEIYKYAESKSQCYWKTGWADNLKLWWEALVWVQRSWILDKR